MEGRPAASRPVAQGRAHAAGDQSRHGLLASPLHDQRREIMPDPSPRGGKVSRRQFAKTVAATGVTAVGLGMSAPYVLSADAEKKQQPRSKNDRLRIGAIGVRYQGAVIAKEALHY